MSTTLHLLAYSRPDFLLVVSILVGAFQNMGLYDFHAEDLIFSCTRNILSRSKVIGELLGYLAAFGLILQLSSTLLRLNVLALGNLVDDLVAGVFAKTGQLSMVGCLVGLMFSMPFGLRTCPVIETAEVFLEAGQLNLQTRIVVTFVFLLPCLMRSLLVVTWYQFRVPKFWGFMPCWGLHYFHGDKPIHYSLLFLTLGNMRLSNSSAATRITHLVLSFSPTILAFYQLVVEGIKGYGLNSLAQLMVKNGVPTLVFFYSLSMQHVSLQVPDILRKLQGNHHLEDKVNFKGVGNDTPTLSDTVSHHKPNVEDPTNDPNPIQSSPRP